MAAASGLTLLEPREYDPLRATTYGTGKLIAAALDRGCGRIMVGAGGSATVDAGCGAARALGVRFPSADGTDLTSPLGGGQLGMIERIDLSRRDPRLQEACVTVLCDVTNPLCGPNGAARVFGPQKGADAAAVRLLEANLEHLAAVIQRDLGVAVRSLPGGGAAGGLAAGLHAFLGARLARGIDAVLDAVGFDRHLRGADWVITGEGRLDAQSGMGKVVGGVVERARTAGVRVMVLAGQVAAGAEAARIEGLHAVHGAYDAPPTILPGAGEAAARLTQRAAEAFAGM